MIKLLGFSLAMILFPGGISDGARMSAVLHPITVLALNTWAEARGEPYEGKLAVAYTVVNRVGDPRWPKTVADVVFQAFQFSWTNPGDPNRMKLDEVNWDDPSFVDAHKAASAAYYGLTPDPSAGANHYFNRKAVKVVPLWSKGANRTAVIGSHEFFRL